MFLPSISRAVLSVVLSLFYLQENLIGDVDNLNGFSNLVVPAVNEEFDFIIVGGGTAGSVIAARLSEDPTVRVLVIEAGSDGSLLVDIPVGIGITGGNDKFDWRYRSEPEPTSCLGFLGGSCTLNRGKMLGGSSGLNAMLYVRGNRKDYDLWALEGNIGWGFDDLLPYFKKSEDNRIPFVRDDLRFHGQGGPITVSLPTFRTPLSDAWLQAGIENGYALVDYNGEFQTGFSLAHLTTRDGRRMGAARGYLRGKSGRRNLKVVLHAFATKILIDDKNRAYGVDFIRQGQPYTVRASKEVILSTGALISPQLLKLSGIGPKLELARFGIPLKQNLPVGLNMEHHVSVGGIMFTVEKPVTLLLGQILTNVTGYIDYFLHGQGPLGTTPVEGVAFINTPLNTDPTWPDIEIEFEGYNPITGDGGTIFPNLLGVKPEIMEVYRPVFNQHSVHLTLYVNRPKSRGQILLRSADPFVQPKIVNNWFQVNEDVQRTIAAIKIAIQLMKAKAFEEYGVKFFPGVLPGCSSLVPFSDAYWECHIRTFSWTQWHETSTCKMGPPGDPLAVVDTELRVFGVQGLTVADTSIFPHITSGNTQAPTYVVGEKASDIIKRRWNLKS